MSEILSPVSLLEYEARLGGSTLQRFDVACIFPVNQVYRAVSLQVEKTVRTIPLSIFFPPSVLCVVSRYCNQPGCLLAEIYFLAPMQRAIARNGSLVISEAAEFFLHFFFLFRGVLLISMKIPDRSLMEYSPGRSVHRRYQTSISATV